MQFDLNVLIISCQLLFEAIGEPLAAVALGAEPCLLELLQHIQASCYDCSPLLPLIIPSFAAALAHADLARIKSVCRLLEALVASHPAVYLSSWYYDLKQVCFYKRI